MPPAKRSRRRGSHAPLLQPIEPFATTGLEHPTSPVRTRRLRPPDIGYYRRIIWPAIDHFISDEGFVLAGYIAFTSLFALFPFIIFLLAFAGFWGQGEAATESIQIALALLPAEVAAVLQPVIEEVRGGPHGTLITFSVILTLWFSSSGLESLRHALNLAYGVTEPPAFWANRLKSIGVTIAASALILSAMVIVVGLPLAHDLLQWLSQRDVFEQPLDIVARYATAVAILIVVNCGIYKILPNVHLRLRDILPGAITSVTIWIGTTALYSVYLRSFGRYSILYGSLGGVIFTLFYFYISAIIFIFGAQLNAAIMRERAMTRRSTATAPGE